MASWHGDDYRIVDWFPFQNASDAGLKYFLSCWPDQAVKKIPKQTNTKQSRIAGDFEMT